MTTSADLSTTYLGLHLPNPFMVGASPLVDHLDTVKRLEDAGCATIVMHSLFEEQVTAAQTGRIRHLDPLNKQFATVLSCFPETTQYVLGSDEHLERLRRIKSSIKIPVVASFNGTTAEVWLAFAQQTQQAGADALELSMYEVVTDPKEPGAAIERGLGHVVHEVTRSLKVPNAVALSPSSLAVCAGVAHPNDGIKSILAGAHAVQMVSAIVRHGPAYLAVMRDGLARWMDSDGFGRLDDVRGRLSLAKQSRPECVRAGALRSNLE